MPAPFLVQTHTFHNQVPDISVNYVGQYAATHSHGSMGLFATRSSFCATLTIVRVAATGSNYTSHIRACCLFEGKLWATDGYLINKFPLDHSVFMLHASHSTSVLQSLMGFSQLSCFPSNVTKNDLWSEWQNGFSSR